MSTEPWTPGKLISTSRAYWESAVIHAAARLDIATKLGQDALTAAAIAQKVEADPHNLSKLLNALTAMGLLQKSGDLYENTPASLTYLSRHSMEYVGHIIQHHHHLMHSWSHLDEAVRSGQPVRENSSDSADARENFLMGMFDLALMLAPRIAEAVDLSGRKKLPIWAVVPERTPSISA